MAETLTNRALNRATSARQHLLERTTDSVGDVVARLVGLQAQETHSWYIGLWDRIADFDPLRVNELMESRGLVRIVVMRSTIHLVTADDALGLRPLVDPVIEKGTKGNWGRHLNHLDWDEVADMSRTLFVDGALTFAEIGRRLQEHWPNVDAAALAHIPRTRLALVQVPPRGMWSHSGAARHMPIETWLDRPRGGMSLDGMVLRYLAAFGPASVRDVQTWCGLTRLREVFDRLRPELLTFNNEDGVELFDIPDAPRPDPDVVAPVRLLYRFENCLLSYADRSRFIPVEHSTTLNWANALAGGTFTVDGFTAGLWRVAADRNGAKIILTPASKLAKRLRSQVEAEAVALLQFLHDDLDHDVDWEG